MRNEYQTQFESLEHKVNSYIKDCIKDLTYGNSNLHMMFMSPVHLQWVNRRSKTKPQFVEGLCLPKGSETYSLGAEENLFFNEKTITPISEISLHDRMKFVTKIENGDYLITHKDAKLKTYVVSYDKSEVYNEGSQISNFYLIFDWLETANPIEDADTIGYIYQCLRDNLTDNAVSFICDAWEITLEEEK